MEDILSKVKEYINQKHSSKKWEAGKDWVQYAGPCFDENEYIYQIIDGTTYCGIYNSYDIINRYMYYYLIIIVQKSIFKKSF